MVVERAAEGATHSGRERETPETVLDVKFDKPELLEVREGQKLVELW